MVWDLTYPDYKWLLTLPSRAFLPDPSLTIRDLTFLDVTFNESQNG